jgi:hypothetical protein
MKSLHPNAGNFTGMLPLNKSNSKAAAGMLRSCHEQRRELGINFDR